MINYYYVFLSAMGGFLVGSVLKSYVLAAIDAIHGEDSRQVLAKIQGGEAVVRVTIPEGADRDDALEVVASHAFLLRGRLRPCECCGAIDGQHYIDEDGEECPLNFGATAFMTPAEPADADPGDEDGGDKPN